MGIRSFKKFRAFISSFCLLAAGLCLSGVSAFVHADESSITTADFRIPAATGDFTLFLRNKHLAQTSSDSAAKTILFIHGASLPSESYFDVPLDGKSWADTLASAGYDVWYVDVRGYGKSGIPETVKRAGPEGTPFATTADAASDLGTAVDYILKRKNIASLHLIGWSWGTSTISIFASAHPEKVESLALIGPVWLRDAYKAAPPTQPWAYWTYADALRKLQNGAPAGEAQAIFPASYRQSWERVLLASQPEAAQSSPEKFRSPTGVAVDLSQYWGSGKPLYAPESIKVPVLLLVGEWDQVTPLSNAEAILAKLKQAPHKALYVIPRATHFVAVETGHNILWSVYRNFLWNTAAH